MFRWIIVCLLLSAAAVALVYSFVGTGSAASNNDSQPVTSTPAPVRGVARGDGGYGADRLGGIGELIEIATPSQNDRTETIVVPNGRLVIAEQEEVPSEQEGKLVFIGTELKPGEPLPPKDKRATGRFGYLAIEIGRNDSTPEKERFTLEGDSSGKHYRRGREDSDSLEPGKIKVCYDNLTVRKLEVGMWVERGQLLALVDPDLAFDNLSTEVAHLNAAEAERRAAIAAREEASRKVASMEQSNRLAQGAVSLDDIQTARLTTVTKQEEELAKEAGVQESQRKVNAAWTKLKKHAIHASIDGVVRQIYKNLEGDAVKALEAVVQLQNPTRLRVEGLLEVQEAQKLEKDMEVIVEPTRPVPPTRVMGGHLDAVTCVAVSKGETPIVISGSADHSLAGWDSRTGLLLWSLSTGAVVPRALTCTAPSSSRNLVLFGCSDGTAYLLDLNNRKEKPRALGDRHKAAISCVAFSPDGELCVTGSDDRALRLWKTDTGELLHTLPGAHQNAVTSVQFASATRMVSAGRDGRFVVWQVQVGKTAWKSSIDGRTGDVAQIGVSPDGQYVLYDQGKDIRVLSLKEQRSEGTVHNNSATTNFTTLALFAPDGKTILTNGGGSGLLQLWRTPSHRGRASELRQFIWQNGPVTSAAFSPDGRFMVSGTQDQVLLWTMPDRKEVEEQLKGKLVLVEKHLETSSREVRVWAELNMPSWELIPGGRATMVIPRRCSGASARGPAQGDRSVGDHLTTVELERTDWGVRPQSRWLQ
jgi:WD40 repeat protein